MTAERTGGQRPLLIWFPWSTLVLGGSDMDAGNGLAEALADALDVVVAVVDVGLAPERGYPHSTEAGLDAVEWLLRQVHQARGQVGGLVPTPLHVSAFSPTATQSSFWNAVRIPLGLNLRILIAACTHIVRSR